MPQSQQAFGGVPCIDFANGAVPEMALRVKMGQTSLVEAVAKTADGKFYIAKKEVKVTVGGCGG